MDHLRPKSDAQLVYELREQIIQCEFNLHVLTSGQPVSPKERRRVTTTSVEENEGFTKEAKIKLTLMGKSETHPSPWEDT